MGAHETIVRTATRKCVLKQTESGVLLSKDEVAPIIPLGEVVGQGGTIDWKPGQCRLRHPQAGTLKVNVVANCPYISLEDGEAVGCNGSSTWRHHIGVLAGTETINCPQGDTHQASSCGDATRYSS